MKANVDVLYTVKLEEEGKVVLKCDKLKDCDRPVDMGFRKAVVHLGDGDSSLVMNRCQIEQEAEVAKPKKRQPKGEKQRYAL